MVVVDLCKCSIFLIVMIMMEKKDCDGQEQLMKDTKRP